MQVLENNKSQLVMLAEIEAFGLNPPQVPKTKTLDQKWSSMPRY